MCDHRATADLDLFYQEFADCTECSLASSRRHIVTGRGPGKRAGLVLVADRVSGYDETTGVLLGGPEERLLSAILAAPKVEIPPGIVYLTSTVLCRAPADRLPRRREVLACNRRLYRELALLEPRVIVALGEAPFEALTAEPEAAGEGGRWHLWQCDGITAPVCRTLHLREGLWGVGGEVVRKKRRMYDDWQAISARLNPPG